MSCAGDKSLWLDYGAERRGRFVNLVNKDGSKRTECGIHKLNSSAIKSKAVVEEEQEPPAEEPAVENDVWSKTPWVHTLRSPEDVSSAHP